MREASDLIGLASLGFGKNLSSSLANSVQQQAISLADLASMREILCGSGPSEEPPISLDTAGDSSLLGSHLGAPLATQSPDLYMSIKWSEAKPLSKLLAHTLLEPLKQFDEQIDYYFSSFWSENGDERANKLPFMSGAPWKLLYATIVYLYLIKSLLPKLMRNQKPFELNWFIRAYNLFMVVSNIFAFYHGARILNWGLKCFGCEVINHQDVSPTAIELLHYGWMFFISRIVEWLDTIFFVLRKKDRQVTKLHVFHHSFVPLISWVYLKFNPGYSVAFFPFVNALVHSIMYTYYFLATFGPSIQPYLWWKKYLTSMQIIQFVLILIQLGSIPLSANEDCQYPQGFLYVALAGAVLFLWLFFTYYIDTYRPKPSDKCKVSTEKRVQKNGYTNKLTTRDGSSRALADTIENAFGPLDVEPTKSLKKD